MGIPRKEFPRLDFYRKDWMSLNGIWKFDYDDEITGNFLGHPEEKQLTKEILVPFCYQSAMSGIGDSSYHEKVWYGRKFQLSGRRNKRVLLKFGAVDYEAGVWVNSFYVGRHEGGHTQFEFDITEYVREGDNELLLFAADDRSCDKPRGKQFWKDKPERCWYTETTGIWQSVWLEFPGTYYLEKIRLTPDIDKRCIKLDAWIDGKTSEASLELEVEITYEGQTKKQLRIVPESSYVREVISLMEEDYVDEIHYWYPDSPKLYDIRIRIYDRETKILTDEVESYFGMRKIEQKDGHFFLNNKQFYFRTVLDQGYWKESLMTPPSDEAIQYDIRMTKEFGFNGVRKHQKFEDPRYYYWADRMGLAVWGEMPSCYQFNTCAIARTQREWMEFLEQSYNHPSILVWVPFNESWGIRNVVEDRQPQEFVKAVYHLTKAVDDTRLISSNDGWEQIEETDIFGIHDYEADGTRMKERYRDFSQFLKTGIEYRQALAKDNHYCGQPVVLTEFGGIAFDDGNKENWGYHKAVQSEEEFLYRLGKVMKTIREIPYLQGYCYTQLTDVMQEINGLMTMERKIKIAPEKIRAEFFCKEDFNG